MNTDCQACSQLAYLFKKMAGKCRFAASIDKGAKLLWTRMVNRDIFTLSFIGIRLGFTGISVSKTCRCEGDTS